MRKIDLAFASALGVALLWMAYVDGRVACGFAFDWSNLPGCGWAAILRELVTVGGAICGVWALVRSVRREAR